MNFLGVIRWLLFVVYLSLFWVVPLYLLFDLAGLYGGLCITVILIFSLGFRATTRISRRLQLRWVWQADHAVLFGLVREYCRRLDLPMPRIGILDVPFYNVAVFGFTKHQWVLAVTKGLVTNFSREGLSAIIARELTRARRGNVALQTWLTMFLSVYERLTLSSMKSPGTTSHLPIRGFVLQLVLYPLLLFPISLMTTVEPQTIDFASVKLSRRPKGLADAFRLIALSYKQQQAFVPLSLRHLFLYRPQTSDVVGNVFFREESFKSRITHLLTKIPVRA